MFLQDSKSSAWDKRGVIVSVRLDNLSYIIRSDNRHFTRPRRLLRPVPTATSLISTSPGTPSSEPVTLRRSSRLQGRAPSAQVHFSDSNTSLRQPTFPSSQQWLPSLRTDKASLTRSISNDSLKNISRSTVNPPAIAPRLPSSMLKRTQKLPLILRSQIHQVRSPLSNLTTAFPSSTSTGLVLAHGSHPSSQWFLLASSLPAAVTSGAVDNARPGPATPSSCMPSPQ